MQVSVFCPFSKFSSSPILYFIDQVYFLTFPQSNVKDRCICIIIDTMLSLCGEMRKSLCESIHAFQFYLRLKCCNIAVFLMKSKQFPSQPGVKLSSDRQLNVLIIYYLSCVCLTQKINNSVGLYQINVTTFKLKVIV